MRDILKRPAFRVGLAVVLLAVLAGIGLGVYAQVTAFSYGDLRAALIAAGATVQKSGMASTLTFQGTEYGLVVDGVPVAAYEYGTAIAAQLDAARSSPDGATFQRGFWPLGGTAITVDWIAPPHHYRRGRVIVTYIGADLMITQLLTRILGPQFAGGPAPSSSGTASPHRSAYVAIHGSD